MLAVPHGDCSVSEEGEMIGPCQNSFSQKRALKMFFKWLSDTVTHEFQALLSAGLGDFKVSDDDTNSLCIWHLTKRTIFFFPIKLRKTTKHY